MSRGRGVKVRYTPRLLRRILRGLLRQACPACSGTAGMRQEIAPPLGRFPLGRSSSLPEAGLGGNSAHIVCAASRRDAKGTPLACLFSWVYDKLKFLILSIAPSHQFPFSVFASCKPPCPGIFFVSIPCIAAFFRRTEAAIKCNALRKDFLIIIRS